MFDQNRTYTFSELRSIIKESSTQPILGKDVVKDDKANNKEAVSDILKGVDEVMKNVKGEKKDVNPQGIMDINKTTLDARFAYDPGKTYKDHVEAEVKGFPSKENEKTSTVAEDDSLNTDGNKKFYDERKKINKEMGNRVETDKHAGLKSHNLPKDLFKNRSAFSEGKSMKRLVFKNTEFLNENQLIKKIPDDFKVDGNKFVVMDKKGTEFLIECKKDEVVSEYIHVNVVNSINKDSINESIERIKELAGYKSADYTKAGTQGFRQDESKKLDENIARVKELIKG